MVILAFVTQNLYDEKNIHVIIILYRLKYKNNVRCVFALNGYYY